MATAVAGLAEQHSLSDVLETENRHHEALAAEPESGVGGMPYLNIFV